MFRYILSAGFAAILSGCLQPEGPSGGPIDTKNPILTEPDRMAGATSSTNWPAGEDAGSGRALVDVAFGNDLVFNFKDTTDVSISVTGSVALYRSGIIPALASPESTLFTLANQPSFMIRGSDILRTDTSDSDTVGVSVLVRIDSLQGLITGIAYLPDSNRFIRLGSGHNLTRFTYPICIPKFGFNVLPGTSLPQTKISPDGKMGWCFYIPGTSLFYKVPAGDTLFIGPMPQGTFPVRLLTLTPDVSNPNLQTLAIYETKNALQAKPPGKLEVTATQKIAEVSTKSSIGIRF